MARYERILEELEFLNRYPEGCVTCCDHLDALQESCFNIDDLWWRGLKPSDIMYILQVDKGIDPFDPDWVEYIDMLVESYDYWEEEDGYAAERSLKTDCYVITYEDGYVERINLVD